MKMTKKDYNEFKNIVMKHVEYAKDKDISLFKKRKQEIIKEGRYKNLSVRLMFMMFNIKEVLDFGSKQYKKGLNDDHIETALRKIFKEDAFLKEWAEL